MLPHPEAEPIYIATQQSLAGMAGDLIRYPILAVDTESNSLYVYREQVCLIQFSTGEKDYLIDTLAGLDFSVLAPIFANAAIEKVFHAAEYDLICLKRDFGFAFNHIFDTMIAARILGRQNIGLASMLASEFDILLQKKYQRANWGKRPLSKEMLNYARMDTFFLIDLRRNLHEELIQKGLLPLAEEDFKRLTSVNPPNGENNKAGFCRVSGNTKMTPAQTSTLQELCRFRENEASQSNLPPFKVLGNQVLLEIALSLPKSLRELQVVQGLNAEKIRRYGEGLVHAVQVGREKKPLSKRVKNRPGEEFLERIEKLRKWRIRTARELGVESDVVLPRDLLERVADENPATIECLGQVMQDSPWRFHQYGEQIMKEISRKGSKL